MSVISTCKWRRRAPDCSKPVFARRLMRATFSQDVQLSTDHNEEFRYIKNSPEAFSPVSTSIGIVSFVFGKSLPTYREDDAKPHFAAVHLFVSFGDAIERILFDHRMHTAQQTKFQGVLRIPGCAGIPSSD